MTTLNTIIEEEKKGFDENWQLDAPDETTSINENIKDFIVTAMQRAYEAGQEETIDELKREGRLFDVCDDCGCDAKQAIKELLSTLNK